jgi:hypothetical protein
VQRRIRAGLGLLVVGLLMAVGGRAEASMVGDPILWVGRYAMELRVASTTKLPLLPSERSTTVSLMLVDIHQGRDGILQQRHHVCDVRVEGSSSVRMTVPPAFVRALGSRQYPVQLRSGSDQWRYVADMGLEAIGFDPRAGDQLPRNAADPRARDSDGDGNPGATVELHVPVMGRARLFIAQRSHLVLRAEAESPDRVSGRVDIRLMEQRTLGADPAMFRRTPDIRPDPDGSGFTLVRLPEGIGCGELARQAHALFGTGDAARIAR